MALLTEPLTGGLVTASEASLLGPGELTLATNGIYRPFSPALSILKGRTTFQAVGAAVTGLRAVPFDSVTPMAVVYATGTEWRRSSGSGETVVRTGVTAGNRLEAVHYNNKYVLANGVNSQIVLSSDYSNIGHGMKGSVEGFNTFPDTSIIAGTWDPITGAGIFRWWITEYDSINDIESASSLGASQIATAVETVALTNKVKIDIAFTAKTNPNATHWRIYRTLPLETVNFRSSTFPIGFRITTYDVNGADQLVEIPIPGTPSTVTRYDQGDTSNTPYSIIVISVQGAPAVTISADSFPPVFSTGDIFEDQLVVNDMSDRSLIRYSYPGKIHSYPSLYFVNFETKQFDEVTYIRTVGETCVVGLENQVWRLNYLPNETDSEFSRGRCRELISANHGIIGPDAACLFSMVDGAPLLAHMSHDGIYMTDGFKVQTLTDDIDWPSLLSTVDLSSCVLVNFQSLYCLFLYYVVNGGVLPNNRVMTFSYHPRHLKNGQLKAAGPTTLTARAVDYADFRAFAAANDIHLEDQTAGAFVGTARSRFIYPDGRLDSESYVERQAVLFGSATHTASTIALRRRSQNAADVIDAAVALSTAAPLVKVENHGRGEAFGAEIVFDADVFYVGFEHNTGQGR